MKGYLCPYFSFLEIEVLMASHKERERALSWGSVLKDAHFVLFHEAISKDFNRRERNRNTNNIPFHFPFIFSFQKKRNGKTRRKWISFKRFCNIFFFFRFPFISFFFLEKRRKGKLEKEDRSVLKTIGCETLSSASQWPITGPITSSFF